MSVTYLVADLHLSRTHPEIGERFRAFLRGPARKSDGLYILGDLFEAWLGDDLILPEHQLIVDALLRLTTDGVPVYVMHGNRDFLLGERFTRMTGCRLIDEGTVVDLYGTPTLLLHGDSLCTDDLPYQQLRQMLRDPQWIADFLAKPPTARIAIVQELREKSRDETGRKADYIMDVNGDEVARVMSERGVHRLVHGHTHRPGHHYLQIDGDTAERIVVGAWEQDATIAECDTNGCRLRQLP